MDVLVIDHHRNCRFVPTKTLTPEDDLAAELRAVLSHAQGVGPGLVDVEADLEFATALHAQDGLAVADGVPVADGQRLDFDGHPFIIKEPAR